MKTYTEYGYVINEYNRKILKVNHDSKNSDNLPTLNMNDIVIILK